MTDFAPSPPEREEVALTLGDAAVTLKNWKEYSFESNFLEPADRWGFTIGAERLSDDVKKELVCGAAVKLTVNGLVQSSGFIDSIEISASRSSGTEYRIEGRDTLAQAVDACADPTVSFKQGQTLEDALKTLFGPFGFKSFDLDPSVDRDIKAGQTRGTKRSKGKKTFGRELKSVQLHQLRPRTREGVYEFASRVCERFGLRIWASANGTELIVGKPEFEQEKSYVLRRNNVGTSNVLDGSVKFDLSQQPTLIIADGFSGGGEFGRGRIKTISANTAVYTSDPAFSAQYKKYPDARPLDTYSFATPMKVAHHRPLILHDEESQTQEQLDNYVKRELALLQRRSLTVSYTVMGHGQLVEGGAFSPWVVDSIVTVQDDIAGLREDLYLLGRTFQKSRSGGTTTRLELIRKNTLAF